MRGPLEWNWTLEGSLKSLREELVTTWFPGYPEAQHLTLPPPSTCEDPGPKQMSSTQSFSGKPKGAG